MEMAERGFFSEIKSLYSKQAIVSHEEIAMRPSAKIFHMRDVSSRILYFSKSFIPFEKITNFLMCVIMLINSNCHLIFDQFQYPCWRFT